MDNPAVCRNCGKILIGKAYHLGGQAYHPVTKKRCPANYYGGFVCCEECDRQASVEQEASMPGGGGRPKFLSTFAANHLKNNWSQQ